MYIDGYFGGISYGVVETYYANDPAAYADYSEDTVLLVKAKNLELCAVQVPVIQSYQQIVDRITTVNKVRYISLFVCITVSIWLSGGLFKVLYADPFTQFCRTVLFWIPPCLVLIEGKRLYRPFSLQYRKLFQECISKEQWIPITALDSKVLEKLANIKLVPFWVLQGILIGVCYYLMKNLQINFLYYIIQIIITNMAYCNRSLLITLLFCIAWLKYKATHK